MASEILAVTVGVSKAGGLAEVEVLVGPSGERVGFDMVQFDPWVGWEWGGGFKVELWVGGS